MPEDPYLPHGLLLRVGVVGPGVRCLSVMRMLHAIKPSRLRLKLLAVAPTTRSVACSKFAGEMDIEICDHYRDLLTLENLDLILELTGDPEIISELMRNKSPSVGVLDRQAAMLFFDVARLYQPLAERESEISLATSFASAMLEASPDGVMIIDPNYRIIKRNRSVLVNGVRGMAIPEGGPCYLAAHGFVVPCQAAGQVCPMNETIRTGRPARAVHEIPNAKGEPIVCHMTTYPLFNSLGEIVQVVEVIRDLSVDFKMRIDQRAQAIKDDLTRFIQEDRLASLGRLVASVCHEINNPISSIVTFNKLMLNYIRENRMPPQGLSAFDRYLDLSVREAMRCGNIVKNLLTFARQKNIKARQIDLVEMIRTTMVLINHQLESTGVQSEVVLPDPPFCSWGDYAQIQQCLMNLLFNAIEAMPDGGRLAVSGGRDGRGNVWIKVADTGCGITSEDLARIFEPFYSTKEEGQGVGLGLSMVYGIVREHNGKVNVKSQHGVGTEFEIVLPEKSDSADGDKGGPQ